MNVIGFSGSPRANGNTAWAVGQLLEGAKQAGAETVLLKSGDIEIKPCKGCLGCKNGGGCVQKDDMRTVYDLLKTADALVIGSPIYMGQMSAQAKAFTDRLYAQISPRFSPMFKEENAGKKLILIFTQGNPDRGKFMAYVDYTAQMFKMLEFDVKDVIVVAGARSEAAKDMHGLKESLLTAGAKLYEDKQK